MKTGELGKTFHDGEVIIRQGEPGDRMYIVQTGTVAVIAHKNGQDFQITNLKTGDVFGEMALFQQETRSATVRAVGEARVITVDKKGFLRRVHEDPSLAYRILQQMSERLRRMNGELSRSNRGVFVERRSFKGRRTIDRRQCNGNAAAENRIRADRRGPDRRKNYCQIA